MAGEKAGSGKKRKKSELVATAGLIVIFILYMFPFYMVVITSEADYQRRGGWSSKIDGPGGQRTVTKTDKRRGCIR